MFITKPSILIFGLATFTFTLASANPIDPGLVKKDAIPEPMTKHAGYPNYGPKREIIAIDLDLVAKASIPPSMKYPCGFEPRPRSDNIGRDAIPDPAAACHTGGIIKT